MHGGPLHHQADHPALVVERVVHPLLFAALRGLGVVGARRVKDESKRRGQRSILLTGRQKGQNVQLKGYWAIRTGHS